MESCLAYYRASSTATLSLDTLFLTFQEDLQAVEQLLHDAAWGPLPMMPQVTEHLLAAGGKRLRPLLSLLAARLCHIPQSLAWRVAAAGELIHTASLLHDDVVDETPLRRGRPSAPRVFGNSACVLIGDALLARSIYLLAKLNNPAPLAGLARCVRRMTIGEIQQLLQAGKMTSNLLSYLRIIEGKTSGLFAWCSTAGELCPDEFRYPLRRFGRCLGMAFQIADDILDYTGDPTQTGKAIGADLREGKITLPLFYALRARPELLNVIQDLGQAPSTEGIAWLVAEVQKSGGTAMAKTSADLLLTRAHRALKHLPPSPWREHLHALADYVVQRNS